MADPASATPAQSKQGHRPQGILLFASSCLPCLVIPSGTKNLTHARQTLRPSQNDNW